MLRSIFNKSLTPEEIKALENTKTIYELRDAHSAEILALEAVYELEMTAINAVLKNLDAALHDENIDWMFTVDDLVVSLVDTIKKYALNTLKMDSFDENAYPFIVNLSAITQLSDNDEKATQLLNACQQTTSFINALNSEVINKMLLDGEQSLDIKEDKKGRCAIS